MPIWKRTIELYEAELRDKPDDPNRQRNVALAEKYLGGVLDDPDRRRGGGIALSPGDGAR